MGSVVLSAAFVACGPPPTLNAPVNPNEASDFEVKREAAELPGYDNNLEWFAPAASDEDVDQASVLVETPAVEGEMNLPDITDDQAAATEAQLPSIDEVFDYPVVINRRVLTWIDAYTGKSKRSFEHSLRRSGRFLPMARAIFAEEGVPQDLAFLAHIESGFRPNARSNKRALGLWQFMLGTAKDYGLRCDRYVDERMNPEIATRASARYLRDLHSRYDDWLLALAAYNAGPGNVDKAIREIGSKDFWAIGKTKHLMTETQNFVPSILAATILAKSPGAFGLTEEVDRPFIAEAVVISSATDLSTIAMITGLTVDEIRNDYNPDLLGSSTPPTRSGYALRLPVGYATPTGHALAQLVPGQPVLYSLHRVAEGETLSQIARQYGTSEKQLQMSNRLDNSRSLAVGQEIEIPSFSSSSSGSGQILVAQEGFEGVHVVKSGDSLSQIARRYGVTVKQIQHANRIHDPSKIRPGQTLEIPGADHVVTQLAPQNPLPTIIPAARDRQIGGQEEMGRIESTAHLVEQFRESLDGGRSSSLAGQVSAGAESRSVSGANSAAGQAHGGQDFASPVTASYSVPEIHVVAQGETLSQIGSRYLISAAELRDWNQLGRNNLIQPGQRLYLTGEGALAAGLTPATDSKSHSFYTVAKGDTLWNIARNYGIRVADLRQWNRLRSKSRIYPGQKLKIFG